MSAWPKLRKLKYRRRHRLKEKTERQQNNNFLIVLLSLIVLFETILLLFFITKKTPSKAVLGVSKKETRVGAQKVIPRQPIDKIAVEGREKKSLANIGIIPKILKKSEPKKIRGKVAIVIDDWGYNTNNLNILKEIRFPLTLSILPFHNYSRKIAEFAQSHNHEIMIHMAMEPEDKNSVDLEPKTLMTNMSKETIIDILNDAFDNIPYARGVNNHMGSLATQDEEFLRTVFKELKKKNFYFLDSLSTSNSVGYQVSDKIGVKFAKRSVFLDNDSDPKYIRDQLIELVKKADEDGEAVGIGHDRSNTLKVLKEEMPELAKQGYKFVFVSEIVE